MQRKPPDAKPQPPTAIALAATFELGTDGSVRNTSAALMRLLDAQPPAAIAHVSELIADPHDARQVMDWLRNSQSFRAMQWQIRLVGSKGHPLPVELLVSAVHHAGNVTGYCAAKSLALPDAAAPVVGNADAVCQSSRALMLDLSQLVLARSKLSQLLAAQQAMLMELRTNQAALIASESRLRAITESTRTVMFLKDLEGRYLFANRAFEELFHFSPDKYLGKTDLDLFTNAVADGVRRNDQWVIATGQALEVEEQVLLEDGMHTYSSVKVPVCDPQGNIYAVCGMATDITERKRMENEIRIAAVAFDSPICMLITDENQVIQRVNKAFEASTGFSAAYAVGRTGTIVHKGL